MCLPVREHTWLIGSGGVASIMYVPLQVKRCLWYVCCDGNLQYTCMSCVWHTHDVHMTYTHMTYMYVPLQVKRCLWYISSDRNLQYTCMSCVCHTHDVRTKKTSEKWYSETSSYTYLYISSDFRIHIYKYSLTSEKWHSRNLLNSEKWHGKVTHTHM